MNDVSPNKYLDMLKAELSEKRPGSEPSKVSKVRPGVDDGGSSTTLDATFETFETSHTRPFSPPRDSDGVPCGSCPRCGKGEFWRWPKFHRDHNPRGWVCWFCAPPPRDSGPCDFCGVPDEMLKA